MTMESEEEAWRSLNGVFNSPQATLPIVRRLLDLECYSVEPTLQRILTDIIVAQPDKSELKDFIKARLDGAQSSNTTIPSATNDEASVNQYLNDSVNPILTHIIEYVAKHNPSTEDEAIQYLHDAVDDCVSE
eukprot:gb/GECG01013596.1/.p1 GENE.gb/GECG01013596.1/~~gb/GECG01013596.1/.p1  ORF type:complete len:132 (+),score=18.43 gb/GECG01013596.1/:1-396(+)